MATYSPRRNRHEVPPQRPAWASETHRTNQVFRFSTELGQVAVDLDSFLVVRVVQFFYPKAELEELHYIPGPVTVEVRREGEVEREEPGFIPVASAAELTGLLTRATGIAAQAERASIRGPVDLSYVESDGWHSRPQHCQSVTEAERLRDATNGLSGHDARTRRRWLIEPCTCPLAGDR